MDLIPSNQLHDLTISLSFHRPLFLVNSYKILFDFELLDKFVWSDLKITHNVR